MIGIYQKDGLNIGKVLNAKLTKEQRDEPQSMLSVQKIVTIDTYLLM